MTWIKLRLTAKQKASFEHAARMGGYKNLSEFIFMAAQKHADQLQEKHYQMLANEADRIVFFKALLNPPRPNVALKKAMKRYSSEWTKT